MGKRKNKKSKQVKKDCKMGIFFQDIFSCPVLRAIVFVLFVGAIFFLVGSAVWETKQFFVGQIENEEQGHRTRIESKLSEMKDEMEFFGEILSSIEQDNLITEEESREINNNIRSLSGRLNDIDRYYLDRRFDFSLVFFDLNLVESDEQFEQLKKLNDQKNTDINQLKEDVKLLKEQMKLK
jgi:hypothetical protein